MKEAPSSVGADVSAGSAAVSEPAPAERSLGYVFALWFPLALSFELMMCEGPSLQAAVGRLPDAQLNLAAWGLTISLSLLVESPVIMLLATTIALCRSREAYRELCRFVHGLCLACTAVAGALAFTPLYDLVVVRIMRQPNDIITAARPALGIMLLWTAAIGYRRFYQGILVRARKTGLVSWGTAVRLVSIVAAAVVWVHLQTVPGVQVAALAIMTGVIVEAVVTRIFASAAVGALAVEVAGETRLSQADIVRFHAPLAATTLLTLLAPPLTALALARLPNAAETLAAWPVAFSVMLVIRGGALALQEISVACGQDARARGPLLRFTWMVGLLSSLAAVLLAFTPLLDLYLETALRVPAVLHAEVGRALALTSALPLLTALASWMRGLLMARHATPAVYAAMGACLVTQVGLLALAVACKLEGIDAAAGALIGASVVECITLQISLRRTHVTD